MREKLTIYWARRDLRIHDNPALSAAIATRNQILPLFALEEYMLRGDPHDQFGYPSRLFLAHALPPFIRQFKRFALVRGVVPDIFLDLAKHFELDIHVNEDVYPDFYSLIESFKRKSVRVTVHRDMMTVNPQLTTQTGNCYSIFTPFKKAAWSTFLSAKPLPKADLASMHYASTETLSHIKNTVAPDANTLLRLFSTKRLLKIGTHTIDLDEHLGTPDTYVFPYVDESACLQRLESFIKGNLSHYNTARDMLAADGTSNLSLGLTWGLISSRTVIAHIQKHYQDDFMHIPWDAISPQRAAPITYITELMWREFYKYLLYHTPALMHEEFQEKFRQRVRWADDSVAVERFIAWIRGKTGYPIVDAAMMQLKKTGLMHNRARMIVASVLTKNLGVDWRWGQEYFRAMLLDLDEASNNGGWQWGASVGADPKPIRIFNPYTQAKNYDPDAAYQKRWLSEEQLRTETPPLVAHKDARVDALKRYGLPPHGSNNH